MAYKIKWDNSLKTGIAVIDRQHKEFFKLVNRLLDNSASAKKKEPVLKAFDFLKIYILEHFSIEESLMLDYKYAAYKQHRTAHQFFKSELQKLEYQLQGNHFEEVSLRLNYLIVNWFMNHIKVRDKEMSAFLMNESETNSDIVTRLKGLFHKLFGT